MNWRMYLSFFKWCFLKMFSGCFSKAATFRHELKKGAPDSIFACFAFIALAGLGFIVLGLVLIGCVESREVGAFVIFSYFALTIFAFFYNIFKAAFECFKEDYEEPFEILKNRE
jgi:hypothetical protein